MPDLDEPTCSEVFPVAAHHSQPLVSVSVLEVLPGPVKAREHSL